MVEVYSKLRRLVEIINVFSFFVVDTSHHMISVGAEAARV